MLKEEERVMDYAIEELKKKCDNLEYKEIRPLKEEVSKLRTDYAVNIKLVEQCTETSKALNETLSNMSGAMIELKLSMEHSNQKVDELGEKMDSMQDKINSDVNALSERVTGIDNKTKIDTSVITNNSIVDIMSKILPWIVMGGLGYYMTTLMG